MSLKQSFNKIKTKKNNQSYKIPNIDVKTSLQTKIKMKIFTRNFIITNWKICCNFYIKISSP